MKQKDPYTKLHNISKEIATLAAIEGLLEWDQETYMPHGAISLRSSQKEMMASFVHKQKTGPKFSKALKSLIDLETGAVLNPSLPPAKQAALREWRRDYLKLIKLPNSFVKTFAKTTSKALFAWAEAKKKNKFKDFAPHLEKIVSLARKKADLLGFKEHPYDALLDLYEPEMTCKFLTPLFQRLKHSLSDLLKIIQNRPSPQGDFLEDSFSSEKQIAFGHFLLNAMGFEHSSFRLDLSNHPFCMGFHPKDIRMTTKIHPKLLMSNIFSVIHEGGHGLYHTGLPEEEFGSPLGEAISLGIDESQSRWWETRVGRSFSFWKHFYPLLQKEFPEKLNQVSLETFYKAINKVSPSFIRIEADEVTYSMHIILRFEIEKMLIEGALKTKDLPDAWNAKMQELLGICPPNDAEGCLQDIHWSMGAIGYFPTYTLGNLYAAQFFNAYEYQHPNWKDLLEKGDLSQMRYWLKENIHRFGREFTPHEIVKKVTGKELNEKPFIQYLTNKYEHI
jgi:carboxypeptidase Taq